MKICLNILLIAGLMVVSSIHRTESLSMDPVMIHQDTSNDSIYESSSLYQVETTLKTIYDANEKYQDSILGVIYIPGIALDVVMKSNTNSYYLSHDKSDKKNKKGELFASKRSDNEISDLSLIYGHNNADGSKFGRLALSLNSNDSARTLYFFDGEIIKEYKLRFAFDFMDGTQVLERHDLDVKDRHTFLESLYEDSRFKRKSSNHYFDEILYLQTCLKAYGDERLVFAYELVSKGEFHE